MILTLLQNIPTVIGTLLVFGLVAFILWRMHQSKKLHKSGCGSGCACCPNAGICNIK